MKNKELTPKDNKQIFSVLKYLAIVIAIVFTILTFRSESVYNNVRKESALYSLSNGASGKYNVGVFMMSKNDWENTFKAKTITTIFFSACFAVYFYRKEKFWNNKQ